MKEVCLLCGPATNHTTLFCFMSLPSGFVLAEDNVAGCPSLVKRLSYVTCGASLSSKRTETKITRLCICLEHDGCDTAE